VWTLRCQTWPANIAHCLNDVQTLAETRNEKKIVNTAMTSLWKPYQQYGHCYVTLKRSTTHLNTQNRIPSKRPLGHKYRRWRPLLHSQRVDYQRATVVVHTNTIHVADLWFTRNQLLNIQNEETKIVHLQSHKQTFSIQQFTTSQAIILKRFLGKYTNGDGTHVNHRASAITVVGCTRSDPIQYCVCITLHCVFL
jgi:hypothetical protein